MGDGPGGRHALCVAGAAPSRGPYWLEPPPRGALCAGEQWLLKFQWGQGDPCYNTWSRAGHSRPGEGIQRDRGQRGATHAMAHDGHRLVGNGIVRHMMTHGVQVGSAVRPRCSWETGGGPETCPVYSMHGHLGRAAYVLHGAHLCMCRCCMHCACECDACVACYMWQTPMPLPP